MEKKFDRPDKLRFQNCGWLPLSKEILGSAHSGNPLIVAKNMESYENHNVIFDQVMKIFASGEKFSMRKLKYVLMNEYLNKLQNKGEEKI